MHFKVERSNSSPDLTYTTSQVGEEVEEKDSVFFKVMKSGLENERKLPPSSRLMDGGIFKIRRLIFSKFFSQLG